MNMKAKKIWALLLTASMAAGMMAGCGGKKESSVSNVDESGVMTLTFYNADGQEDDPWTDPVAEAITEKTGVRLETEHPVGSDEQKIALMIAEQKFPDMIFAKGDGGSLVEAGVLIDMTDLIEEYGPHIKALYGDEFDKLKYSKDDPSIYQLCCYGVGGTKYEDVGSARMQFGVLKENNYEIPYTLDQFEGMIKDYLAAHPTADDGSDNIGFSLSASDWHWMITLGNPSGAIAEGAPDNGEYLIDDNMNAVYKYSSEKVREYFKWLNRMYNEGILDPEFATQTHDDYIAKVASGRVLALFDAGWDYMDGEKILKQDGKFDKTYCELPVTMDESIKAPGMMYQGLQAGWGVGITTACKNPEEAIKYIDFLCSDEGQVLTNWGIEGVNYLIDEEGHRYRTQEEIDASENDKNYKKNTGVGFHNYPFPCYGQGVVDATGSTYSTVSKEAVAEKYSEEQKAACAAWNVELIVDIFPQADEFETPAYPPTWAMTKPGELTEIEDKLTEIVQAGLVSCVMAKESDFDAAYDKMLADMESTGMAQAEELMTNMVKDKAALME